MWSRNNADFPNQPKGAIFILDRAKDLSAKDEPGNGLFPSILKSDLRPFRSTIEAYSNSIKLEGFDDASACGILLQESILNTGINGRRVKVTTDVGEAEYIIDRWD
jgi:hypothetical protein